MKKAIYLFVLLILLGTIYLIVPKNKEKEKEEIIVPIVYSIEETNLMNEKYYIEENLERYLDYLDIDNYEYTVSAVNSNIDYEPYTNTKSVNLDEGNLILINKYYYLNEDYVPNDLVSFNGTYGSKNYKIKEEVYNSFVKLASDALNENLTIFAVSPYRSYDLQERLYNNYKARDGVLLADTYSARPGFSEHQSGLAIDVSSASKNILEFGETKTYDWMIKNSYKYGFILRYPENKTYITGYQYEPWHYRYVGIDAAKIITENNLTFEEYHAYYVE